MFFNNNKTNEDIYAHGIKDSYAVSIARLDEIRYDRNLEVEYSSLGRGIVAKIKEQYASFLEPAYKNLSAKSEADLLKLYDSMADDSVISTPERLIQSLFLPYREREEADFIAAHAGDDEKIAGKLPLMAEKQALKVRLSEIYEEAVKDKGPEELKKMRRPLHDDGYNENDDLAGGLKLQAIKKREKELEVKLREYLPTRKHGVFFSSAHADTVVQTAFEKRQSAINRSDEIYNDALVNITAGRARNLKNNVRATLISKGMDTLTDEEAVTIIKEIGYVYARQTVDLLVKHKLIDEKQKSALPEDLFFPPHAKKQLEEAKPKARKSATIFTDAVNSSRSGRTSPHFDYTDRDGLDWER